MKKNNNKKIRLFVSESNIDKYKSLDKKVLIVLLFPGAGGLQKTPEESLSWRSPMKKNAEHILNNCGNIDSENKIKKDMANR